jgi:hypothetical protein
VFTIAGLIVQADDNDEYLIEFLDTDDVWQPLWLVPLSEISFGLRTRPNPFNDHEFLRVTPVAGSMVRITGVNGDFLYSVSELQIFDETDEVPEPAAFSLLLIATLTVLGGRHANSVQMRRASAPELKPTFSPSLL